MKTLNIITNMAKRLENFLKKLTLEELKDIRNMAESRIYHYIDGFLYDCKVRSYGRNWTEKLTNSQAVQDLCNQYNGDDGIVDVYTTNPNLNIQHYGDTYYFPTLEDAEVWRNKIYLEINIPHWEEEIKEWDNRENIPFRERPSFAPYITKEDINIYKLELDSLKDIIEPVRLGHIYEENTEEDC